MTNRPVWPHSERISEEDARWFAHHAVVGINYQWEYLSVDWVREWYELLVGDGAKVRVGQTIPSIPECVSFSRLPSGNRGMLRLASWIEDDVRKIDKWDKEHAAEIAEFERLREKLGR